MRRVAVLQSNYIPWKGYFDIINSVDYFIFHDDLQYTKNDWRNRNKIKTHNGVEWLTIPVGDDTNRLICEVDIKDDRWQKKHWRKLVQHYGNCNYFSCYQSFFENAYLERRWTNLSELNQYLICNIAKILGVSTEFGDSRDYNLKGRKLDRLIELLIKTEADHYISGPSARDYIEADKFEQAGISLEYMNYDYPEYPQQYGAFEGGVSILDLLFNVGPEANRYIWTHDETVK